MNSKWNEKLNQVTENTLIVGMDIAKRTHYACFVDERGRVLEKAFAVHQSKEGFEALYQNILDALESGLSWSTHYTSSGQRNWMIIYRQRMIRKMQ